MKTMDNSTPDDATPGEAAPCWVLVALPDDAGNVQGGPDRYLTIEGGDGPASWEWDEAPWMAHEFTDAEKAAFDISVFDGPLEWRQRSG